MLTIYEDKKYVKDNSRIIIRCIYGYFKENVVGKIVLNEMDRYYIEEIDKTGFRCYEGKWELDRKIGGDINRLTNRCKALIIMNHYEELGRPIIELGRCSLCGLKCSAEEACNKKILSRYFERNLLSMGVGEVIITELSEIPYGFGSIKDGYCVYVDSMGRTIKEISWLVYR